MMRGWIACAAALVLGFSAQAGFQWVTALDWSPLGELLLISAEGALWVGRAPTGAEAYQVTPENTWVNWGRFGPEGDWFVYVTPVEDKFALWKGWLQGMEPEELYLSETSISQPAVAPDGTRIAFVGEQNGQTDLFLLDLTTGEVHQLTNTPFPEACPDFSPDGDYLAFVGLWTDGGTSWDLFLLDLTTSSFQQLTDDAFFDWYPRFSPDGEWLAFESNRGGQSDIYVIRRDGGEVIPFTYDEWRDGFPAWSPDGEELAYVKRKPSGWVILVEGAY